MRLLMFLAALAAGLRGVLTLASSVLSLVVGHAKAGMCRGGALRDLLACAVVCCRVPEEEKWFIADCAPAGAARNQRVVHALANAGQR